MDISITAVLLMKNPIRFANFLWVWLINNEMIYSPWQKLSEDNVTGKLTDERFAKLSATYEAEQAELKKSVESLSVIVEAAEVQAVNVKSFLLIVKKYTEPTELTPQLLHEFVEKIVVHEADKSSGHRVQRIDVHYNFIGEIDFSPEYRK